eukprot:6491795-Amphidinium_carterae.1
MVDMHRMCAALGTITLPDGPRIWRRSAMDPQVLGSAIPANSQGKPDVCALGNPGEGEEQNHGRGLDEVCLVGRGTDQSHDRPGGTGGAQCTDGTSNQSNDAQTTQRGETKIIQPSRTSFPASRQPCQGRDEQQQHVGVCRSRGNRDQTDEPNPKCTHTGCHDGSAADESPLQREQRGRVVNTLWQTDEGLVMDGALAIWPDDGVYRIMPKKVRRQLQSAMDKTIEAWPMEELAIDDPDEHADAAEEEWTPSSQQLTDLQIAHDNCGHPPPQRFAQLLRLGGAPKQLVRYVLRVWRCPTCLARQKPQARPPAANVMNFEPNHTVGIDLVELANPVTGVNDYWVDICCWTTNYMQVKRLENKEPQTVLSAFLDVWVRWLGWPRTVVTDQGTEFAGAFGEYLSQHGCLVLVTDARAPWQNSKTERLGGEWKEQMANLLHVWQPADSLEWEDMGVIAVIARNHYVDRTGYSPQQRLMGTGHRTPLSLNGANADDVDPEFLWQGPRADVRRREEMRQLAWKSLVEVQSRERLLRAGRAQHRVPMRELAQGDLVMIWRQPGHQKGTWNGPGTVVMVQGQHVWCSVRGNVWKVTRSHVRPATNEENQGHALIQKYLQTITEELKGSQRGPKRFLDGTSEPRPPDPDEEQAQPRQSKQPRTVPSTPVVPSSATAMATGSQPSTPFRSGQQQPPERPITMPYPAPQTPAQYVSKDLPPHISLQDTTQKEVVVRDLHPSHQRLFLSDTRRGRCKEWLSIVSTPAVRVHTGEHARQLRERWPNRLVPSRWLDRWKHAGADYNNGLDKDDNVDARVEAKSRWVVQGFWDPDVEFINRSTPCPTAQDLMLVLHLISALAVEAMTADVRTAFMQSEPGLRGGDPLFATPPTEGLPAVGTSPAISAQDGLIELLSEVYGLNSGPMGWRITLTKKLKEQGFRNHPLSPCVFVLYDQQNRLSGVLLVETDDLLFGGKGKTFDNAMSNIRASFKFGHWRTLLHKPAEYSGRRLVQTSDYGFEIDMTQYLVEKARPIEICRERRQQPNEELTETERTQYRGLIGSLTWASRMAMPQLAGEVSIMASRNNQATVLDALTVNAMLTKHIKTATPLVVRPIPLSEMAMLVFVDASLANVDSHRSQAGHLVCACEQKVLRGEVGKVSIITYTSHTLHRVVGSTLMAETCALTESLSEVAWVCKWMAMAKHLNFEWQESRQPDREIQIQTVLKSTSNDLKVALATDAKSVYDN